MTNLGTVTVINLNGSGSGSDMQLNEGATSYRVIARAGALCVDKTMTPLGFAGAESADSGITGDWVNLAQF